MAETRDFLLEIGCEEMPSAPLMKAQEQLGKIVAKGLDDAGLAHGAVRTLSTPRRLAVIVDGCATATEEIHEVIRGPKTSIAFDADGNATRAAEGFARKNGTTADALVRRVEADGKDVLSDDEFGISATAIALKRTTEMYQWVEHSKTTEKKNLGGSVTKTTTYTYSKEWVGEAIDSSSFHEPGHDNPGGIEFPSQETRAANVTFGAFRLSERQIERIGRFQSYAFPSGYVCRVARAKVQGPTIFIPNAETRENEKNVRDVMAQPRVGDLRVNFTVVLPHDISIVAKQHGDTFVGYLAKSKKKVDLLNDGVRDMAEMFESARSANTVMTWLVRIGGFLLMFIGLGMVLKPISVLADVLPILGDIVEIGTGIVAFAFALVCSLVTIAVAWIFYRPLLAVVLLAIAGGIVYLVWKKRRAAKQA